MRPAPCCSRCIHPARWKKAQHLWYGAGFPPPRHSQNTDELCTRHCISHRQVARLGYRGEELSSTRSMQRRILRQNLYFCTSKSSKRSTWGLAAECIFVSIDRECIYISIYICIYWEVYIYIYLCVYVYKYIYIYREREREIDKYTG
jgi:hypothetical protein